MTYLCHPVNIYNKSAFICGSNDEWNVRFQRKQSAGWQNSGTSSKQRAKRQPARENTQTETHKLSLIGWINWRSLITSLIVAPPSGFHSEKLHSPTIPRGDSMEKVHQHQFSQHQWLTDSRERNTDYVTVYSANLFPSYTIPKKTKKHLRSK